MNTIKTSNNLGIVPPWLVPSAQAPKNPGIVPPWLVNPGVVPQTNPGIVPPWLQTQDQPRILPTTTPNGQTNTDFVRQP